VRLSVRFTPHAWDEYTSWRDPKVVRRINRVVGDALEIAACSGHYDDK
jgi:Txe/YoeB family toxin of Txe-Axe toxin-antitoxin module